MIFSGLKGKSIHLNLLIFYILLAISPFFLLSFDVSDLINYQHFYLLIVLSLYIPYFIFYLQGKEVTFHLTDLLIMVLALYCVVHSIILKVDIDSLMQSLALIFLYAITKSVFGQIGSSEKIYTVALVPFIGVGIVQALIGLFQFFGILNSGNEYFAVCGTLLNPARLGGYLLLVIPLYFFFIYNRTNKSKKCRILHFILLSVCFIVLILTFNRSAFVGLVAAFLFGAYKIRKIRMTLPRKALLLLAIGLVAFGLSFLKVNSATGRMSIWQICVEKLHPVFIGGVGMNNFQAVFPHAQAAYFNENVVSEARITNSDFVRYPYNEVLNTLIELGIVPFILIVWIIITLFRNTPDNKWVTGMKSALCGIAVYSLFSYPSKNLTVMVLVAVLAGCLAAFKSDVLVKTRFRIPRSWKYVMLIFAFVFLVFQVYSLNLFIRTRKALDLDHKTAYELYKTGERRFAGDRMYLFRYGKCLFRNEEYGRAAEILERTLEKMPESSVYDLLAQTYIKTEAFEKAEGLLQEGIDLYPQKHINKYRLFKLYVVTGREEEAFRIGNVILSQKPKVPSYEYMNYQAEVTDFIQRFNSKN